ncbi:MAG: hypothetical protein PUG48_06155 [Clostridia bacterium]|nr:hypothetical protein [Clostridia bacterium]
MILYYALTTYHIQCCVLHKLKYKPNEKAVLILSDIHKNSVAFQKKYKDSGIFDDVILFGESTINNAVRQRERKHTPTKQNLHKTLKDVKQALPVDINSCDEVYLCPDHFPFGWYIISKHIKYHCFEEGCGVLSNNEFMLSNMKRNKTQYALMNVLGYFGNNKSCVEILADKESQLPGYENPKMTDFSVKRIIQDLSESELNKVFGFFGVSEKINGKNQNLSLILTQHMANLGIMSLDGQHRLYTLFADYFLEGTHITVKPHPDDIAGRYRELFGDNATVLPFAMPSELLPYCIDGRVKTAIAANSTAVNSLGEFCDRTICFDNRILKTFRYLNRYYAAYKLIEHIGKNGSIATNGDDRILCELALNDNVSLDLQYMDILTTDNEITLISDNLAEGQSVEDIYEFLSGIQKSAYVIFLNERVRHNYFDGIHKEVFSHIRPIFITETDLDGKITEEVIYLYSNDSEILEKAENINLTKELKYTGISIDIHSISRSESEKIKMLEGVLEATEKRLNDYIRNKHQLDEEIEALKEGKSK